MLTLCVQMGTDISGLVRAVSPPARAVILPAGHGRLPSRVMADWLVWLIAAGALGIAELLTLTLVLGMLSVAATAAALVAALSGPPALQVAAFAAVALLLLLVVLPVARRHRRTPISIRTGTAALIGRQATAVTAVDRDGGRVRIGGEIWSARPYDDATVIPAGARVDVAAIDGATAVVLPVESP
jgi:membrane protein implicated in regulation of membrane protease activity